MVYTWKHNNHAENTYREAARLPNMLTFLLLRFISTIRMNRTLHSNQPLLENEAPTSRQHLLSVQLTEHQWPLTSTIATTASHVAVAHAAASHAIAASTAVVVELLSRSRIEAVAIASTSPTHSKPTPGVAAITSPRVAAEVSAAATHVVGRETTPHVSSITTAATISTSTRVGRGVEEKFNVAMFWSQTTTSVFS